MLRTGSASRIEYGQLCCVKPAASEHFLLGRISWLMLKSDGSLRAGLHLFPGKPGAIGFRPSGSEISPSEKYTRALHLPAVKGLREPESIIVPKGWFSPGKAVELLTDQQQPIRMEQCVDSGADFERISFTRL